MSDWSLNAQITDLYHQLCWKYGKAVVWNNNDELCDLCEEYIKEKIETLRQKLIEDIKKEACETYIEISLDALIEIINRRFGVDEK